MSYILEALKKLEEKRRRTVTSQDLMSVCAATPQQTGRRPVWRYLITGLLMLNAGLLSWWLLPRTVSGPHVPVVGVLSSPSPISPVSVSEEENAHRVSAHKTASGDSDESHAVVADSMAMAVSPAEKTGVSASSAQGIYQFGDLPASVRQELPGMAISGHFYAADPSSRVVVINGRPMHEGETLAGGLKLERITSDGVVMDYRGYRFSKGVF